MPPPLPPLRWPLPPLHWLRQRTRTQQLPPQTLLPLLRLRMLLWHCPRRTMPNQPLLSRWKPLRSRSRMQSLPTRLPRLRMPMQKLRTQQLLSSIRPPPLHC